MQERTGSTPTVENTNWLTVNCTVSPSAAIGPTWGGYRRAAADRALASPASLICAGGAVRGARAAAPPAAADKR